MMQNHLTEMTAQIAMELPENSGNISEIQSNKLAAIKSVEPLTLDNILLGQYSSYSQEGRAEMKNPEFHSSTPTFAAALVNLNSHKWSGVPFILVSGKKLKAKESYIRVIFKNDIFCVGNNGGMGCEGLKQVVFYIGGTDIRLPPMILVSKGLFKPVNFPKWRFEEITSDRLLFGENITNMYRIMANNDEDAYSALLGAVFHGERHLFIDIQNLLASWDVWSPILTQFDAQALRGYEGADNVDVLNFKVNRNGLAFVHQLEHSGCDEMTPLRGNEMPEVSQIPPTFRDRVLVVQQKAALISTLAENLFGIAQRAVQEKGVFHVAFPGGRSPVPLFDHLARHYSFTFPWKFTHLWLTDERCVPLDHTESNFNTLYEKLVKFVNIPYLNIHPMPVLTGNSPCEEDSGALQYETLIKRVIPSSSFDFVLLGVGTDAHVASLFPEMSAVQETDKLVTLTDGRPDDDIKTRMTLTLPVINQAREVAVLITGKTKHDIVRALPSDETNVAKYPVTGVDPNPGNMTWFIDVDAFLWCEL